MWFCCVPDSNEEETTEKPEETADGAEGAQVSREGSLQEQTLRLDLQRLNKTHQVHSAEINNRPITHRLTLFPVSVNHR